MADYPNLDHDPLPDAIEHLIAVALDSRQYIAFRWLLGLSSCTQCGRPNLFCVCRSVR